MKQRCRILLKAIAEFLDLVARSGRFLLVLGRSCGEGERKEESAAYRLTFCVLYFFFGYPQGGIEMNLCVNAPDLLLELKASGTKTHIVNLLLCTPPLGYPDSRRRQVS